ncbi:MAG: acylneuraminate cytidylyltransferase [Candidatus Riflebacteria bacterium HGW-Riflebacteria-2]|jgi:CMP-N-acetylneuraminic acid synthetase|nr:MAG: acylneuraminate cytidylyltransferase [Candidatus Riflebacteria bacterium HGW-Riflebacteria-2]
MPQTAVETWAIIPARGGSKRLRRKNLLPFDGRPLVGRAVATALASGCFARVLVSTDDEEIAGAAIQAGGEVPFMRPAVLSGDTASSVDVLLHAVTALGGKDSAPATIALIQATSPLLTCEHVRAALKLFSDSGFVSLSSMKEVNQYPEWMFRVEEKSGRAMPESPGGIVAAASSLPRRYIENGAIYLVQTAWLLAEKSLYNFSRHGCYVMSGADSIDIDTEEDFAQAQFELARRCQSDQKNSI